MTIANGHRTHRRGARLVVVLLCSLSTGCAQYERVGKTYRPFRPHIEIQPPLGWLRYNPERPDYVITKDGLRLERITVRTNKVGSELEDTERVYRADMLPQEVAELTLELIDAQEGYENMQVERIDLGDVAGQEAYKAEAAFTDDQGLAKRLSIHGTIISDHVVEFVYEAARNVYFDKYVATYEAMVQSTKVR